MLGLTELNETVTLTVTVHYSKRTQVIVTGEGAESMSEFRG